MPKSSLQLKTTAPRRGLLHGDYAAPRQLNSRRQYGTPIDIMLDCIACVDCTIVSAQCAREANSLSSLGSSARSAFKAL